MAIKEIPAGAFKQGCLRILDEVAASHREVVITKRGKPVAKLVPIKPDGEREAEILAALRSKAQILVDEAELLRPTTADGGWDLIGEK